MLAGKRIFHLDLKLFENSNGSFTSPPCFECKIPIDTYIFISVSALKSSAYTVVREYYRQFLNYIFVRLISFSLELSL